MVKVQKPIPKKLGNKPKLDNPIKKKKQIIKKEKSTGAAKNVKVKLLEKPIQETKATNKSFKGVLKSKVTEKPQKTQNATKKGGNLKKPISKSQKKQSESDQKDIKTPKAKLLPLVARAVAKVVPPVKDVAQKNNKSTSKKPVKSLTPTAKKPVSSDKVIPVLQSKLQIPTKGPVAVPKPKGKKKKENSTPDTLPVVKKVKVVKKVAKLQEKKKRKIEFKKAKLNTEKGKPSNKEKKEQHDIESTQYDSIPFDEEKLNAILNSENIKKVAEALKKQVENEVATKKSSIFDDYQYFLQVGSFKIANCPKRMVKLTLKHALVDKDDDILLVVPDLQRGSKVDYEPTKHHYEDLLRSHGVEGITVMPMNQLRKEYGTFEQKRRLCASYDHFLCDGRIVGHVFGIVGKIGQKPRHTFHAVRLHNEKNIKNEIEKSLRKTAYRQLGKSSLHSLPVGSHKFTSEQLTENVEHVLGQLKTVFPGGLSNIRNMYLKINITGTSALPLYISMAQAPEQTPQVVGTREEKMIKLKRDANKVLSKFAMNKEGMMVKLSKSVIEKKRKAQELRTSLAEKEIVPPKKTKKTTKQAANERKSKEAKDLELPENEDDNDETGDDEGAVRLGGSSDEGEDDSDEMSDIEQVEEDENTSDDEEEGDIVENGLGDDIDEEESEGEEQQDVGGSDDDGDEDDEDEEEDIEDDDEEEEE